MVNLTSSADELLKTRTIPELRDLVNSLENDGNSKITELQVMVGSKYHDFIQSADAISAMQEKSEFLQVNLCGFLSLSQDVVSKTTDLLSRTLEDNALGAKAVTPLKLYKVVDSFDVWKCLEECDIFGAARIVAQCKIFLDTHNTANSKSVGDKCPLPFCRFFSPLALNDLGTSREKAGESTLSQTSSGCSSAIFLSQTVLDDARLFLLEGSCSSEEKASTLAAVGLLTSESTSASMQRGDLLLMYLEVADVLLDAAILGLGERQPRTQNDSLSGKVNTPAARRPSHASSAMGEKLVQAVLMLQQTILDVHLLFFKPARPSVAPSLKSLPVVSGLVLLKQLEFISDIDRALTPLLSRSGTDEKKGLEFDASAFIAHDKTSASPLEIRKIFDQWLGKAVQKVGERARAALEAMESATEVARLQQRVWLCCTTVTAVTTSAATPSIFSPLGYSQADWDESCIELLSVKKRRSFATETNCAATGLLWSRVFRLPFMLQVERLLRESCMGVLRGAKGLLLQSLAQEGVHIDPITLVASLRITGSSARSSGSGSGSGSAVPPPFGLGLSYSYSTLCSPSPRIFRKAEAVRCLLQDELSDLLRDIIVPVQEGDPESSTGLSRALFIQCSQLSGHIAILLRCLRVSLITAIDANVKISQAAQKVTGQQLVTDLSSSPLLSGLLIVGRLAWLLKIRGRFLEEALIPAPVFSPQSSSESASVMYDLVSEDQMRSAFEIADTNGDGVLTYTEAIEAVHALAVSDADNFNSGASDMHTTSGQSSSNNIPFLSPRLTPSLNFNEFALLCAHLMSADACLPVERLKSCFNETLSMAHSQWAKRVVSVYSPSFSTGLAIELGSLCMDSSLTETDTLMASMTSVLSQAKVLPFRSSWRQVWVEPDSTDSSEGTVDPGSANREQVALPTSICTSLAAFLFSFSHAAACSLLSVDTVQQLPPPDLFPTPLTLENGDDEIVESVNRIAHYASTTLFSMALSAAVDTYTTLLKQASSSSEKNLSEEDVAIQAVFDLMACESLGGRCGLQESRALRDCMAGWKARLDPINAEIMIPLLVAASDQFAIKNHLLLPGVKQPKGVLLSVPNVSTSSSSSSSLAAINSNASAVLGLFPTTAASRFSLLPLPMSTHFQGSSWVDRDKERERGSFVAEKPEQQPAFATKTLLSGLSLNQQQQNHAEQIGKSLISTWGTFMGQTQ